MSSARIEIPKDKIANFCRRWKIVEFSLFGSALRDDFGPDSDVDVLVTFAPTIFGARPFLNRRRCSMSRDLTYLTDIFQAARDDSLPIAQARPRRKQC